MRLLSVASVAPSNQKYDGSFGRMVHWKWGYPVIRTHLSTHFYKHRYICRASDFSRQSASATEPEAPLPEIPASGLACLPFSPWEVATPGDVKVLHLYEARFLALLERVMAQEHPILGHVVVDASFNPAGAAQSPGSLVCTEEDAPFTMCFSTLCRVIALQRVGVGAMVKIRCEGRLAIQALRKTDEPYMVVDASVLTDDVPAQGSMVEESYLRLAKSLEEDLAEVVELVEKVYPDDESAGLARAALEWAREAPWGKKGKGEEGEGEEGGRRGEEGRDEAGGEAGVRGGIEDRVSSRPGAADVSGWGDAWTTGPPSSGSGTWERAARMSYGALAQVPGMTKQQELMHLAARIEALSGTSTIERLAQARAYLHTVRGPLRAKLSLKGLGVEEE